MAKSYQSEPDANEIAKFPRSHWCDQLHKAAEFVFPHDSRKKVDEHAVWLNALLADMAKTEM